MTAHQNSGQEKAGGQPGDFSATTKQHAAILPDSPAASKLPSFVIEVLPTPLREPASIVQLCIRFDAKQPLPDDAIQQVLSAINRAKNRALIADSMTPGAKAFWAGCGDE